MLEIKNLHANVEGVEILKGVNLNINPGEVHAIMGPNGSGKSTLANVVMGNPVYEITEGSVLFEGTDITEEPVDNRAKLGMFLAFQYPESIPGVTIVNMLKTALTNIEGTEYTTLELRLKVAEAMEQLGLSADFADRYLNEGFSGGERKRYAEIMGCKESYFDRVCKNISDMMEIKRRLKLPVTIGMQMVLMPKDADQIVPFAKLGAELKPDYAVIKHCSDNEDGDFLGIDYNDYDNVHPLLEEAEKYSTDDYKVIIKWSKIKDKGNEGRSYQRCYGVPFHLQLSGSGLIAPCGPLFNEKYKKVHIGNICKDRFKDIIASDRYWEVVNYLSSSKFNAQTMCSPLCMQHKTNEVLDSYLKGDIDLKKPENTEPPLHKNFI